MTNRAEAEPVIYFPVRLISKPTACARWEAKWREVRAGAYPISALRSHTYTSDLSHFIGFGKKALAYYLWAGYLTIDPDREDHEDLDMLRAARASGANLIRSMQDLTESDIEALKVTEAEARRINSAAKKKQKIQPYDFVNVPPEVEFRTAELILDEMIKQEILTADIHDPVLRGTKQETIEEIIDAIKDGLCDSYLMAKVLDDRYDWTVDRRHISIFDRLNDFTIKAYDDERKKAK